MNQELRWKLSKAIGDADLFRPSLVFCPRAASGGACDLRRKQRGFPGTRAVSE